MIHQTTQLTRSNKTPAISCACCGIKLTAGRQYTVVPGIGTVGPRCEQHVMDASIHLRGAGLGELLNHGSVTLELTAGENGFCTPGQHPTFVRLNTAAQRAGLKIDFRMQQGENGPEMVLTLGGLKGYFKTLRARSVVA